MPTLFLVTNHIVCLEKSIIVQACLLYANSSLKIHLQIRSGFLMCIGPVLMIVVRDLTLDPDFE